MRTGHLPVIQSLIYSLLPLILRGLQGGGLQPVPADIGRDAVYFRVTSPYYFNLKSKPLSYRSTAKFLSCRDGDRKRRWAHIHCPLCMCLFLVRNNEKVRKGRREEGSAISSHVSVPCVFTLWGCLHDSFSATYTYIFPVNDTAVPVICRRSVSSLQREPVCGSESTALLLVCSYISHDTFFFFLCVSLQSACRQSVVSKKLQTHSRSEWLNRSLGFCDKTENKNKNRNRGKWHEWANLERRGNVRRHWFSP